MFKRGLLSLSFDPITFGHVDIINRAMQQCEHLIVAVLNNPDKKSSYVFVCSSFPANIKLVAVSARAPPSYFLPAFLGEFL